jgi:hypothetical protein
VLLMFWIGLYPRPFLNLMEPTVQHYVTRMQERQQAARQETGTTTRQAQSTPSPRTARAEER